MKYANTEGVESESLTAFGRLYHVPTNNVRQSKEMASRLKLEVYAGIIVVLWIFDNRYDGELLTKNMDHRLDALIASGGIVFVTNATREMVGEDRVASPKGGDVWLEVTRGGDVLMSWIESYYGDFLPSTRQANEALALVRESGFSNDYQQLSSGAKSFYHSEKRRCAEARKANELERAYTDHRNAAVAAGLKSTKTKKPNKAKKAKK